jgi:hypothetical protein
VQKCIEKLEKELKMASALEEQQTQAARRKYGQVHPQPKSGYGHRMQHQPMPVSVMISSVEYIQIIREVCDQHVVA